MTYILEGFQMMGFVVLSVWLQWFKGGSVLLLHTNTAVTKIPTDVMNVLCKKYMYTGIYRRCIFNPVIRKTVLKTAASH